MKVVFFFMAGQGQRDREDDMRTPEGWTPSHGLRVREHGWHAMDDDLQAIVDSDTPIDAIAFRSMNGVPYLPLSTSNGTPEDPSGYAGTSRWTGIMKNTWPSFRNKWKRHFKLGFHHGACTAPEDGDIRRWAGWEDLDQLIVDLQDLTALGFDFWIADAYGWTAGKGGMNERILEVYAQKLKDSVTMHTIAENFSSAVHTEGWEPWSAVNPTKSYKGQPRTFDYISTVWGPGCNFNFEAGPLPDVMPENYTFSWTKFKDYGLLNQGTVDPSAQPTTVIEPPT